MTQTDFAMADYPPGPRDDPQMFACMWAAVEDGILVPTDQVRDGLRQFTRTTDPGPNYREDEAALDARVQDLIVEAIGLLSFGTVPDDRLNS